MSNKRQRAAIAARKAVKTAKQDAAILQSRLDNVQTNVLSRIEENILNHAVVIASPQEAKVIGISGHSIPGKRSVKHASSSQSSRTKEETLTRPGSLGREIGIREYGANDTVMLSTGKVNLSELKSERPKESLPAKYRTKVKSGTWFKANSGYCDKKVSAYRFSNSAVSRSK